MVNSSLLSSPESPSHVSTPLRTSPSSESIKSACCCSFPGMSAGRYFRTRRHSSSASTSNSVDHNADNSQTKQTTCNNDPPIVVETTRWTAIPQTFIVREETTFAVICTVVQPVMKNSLAIFKRGKSSVTRKKDIERSGTARPVVDLGGLDNAIRVVDRPSDEQWGNIKEPHRSSGWVDVFGTGETQLQPEPITRQSFLVDHANDCLLIPEVDVGVAFQVREEYEIAGKENGSQETFEFSSVVSSNSVISLECASSL